MRTADLIESELNSLDAKNRERALDLESFIVEAPAGAGKTELLTQRYLKLLAVVDEPEEIVALTFSNKATAEMRNRILLSLESAQNLATEYVAGLTPHKLVTRQLAIAALNRANKRHWNLLTQPARLRIMTIDALCSSLARQMPLLSRFGGQPAVTDNAESHYIEAARRAVSGIMQEHSASDIVTTALRYMDNDTAKLESLLANMLAKRDQWLPLVGIHTQLDIDDISQHIEHGLQHLIELDLQALADFFPPHVQKQLMPIADFSASNLEPTYAINPLLKWNTPLEAVIEDMPKWQAVTELLLTKDGELRKRITSAEGFPSGEGKDEKFKCKQQKEAFFELTTKFPQLEKLAVIRKLPEINEIASNSVTILAISKLLQLAAAHLWTVFKAANEVDFVEIAQSARIALGGSDKNQGVTDLALKLDYQIVHLLIDEFQDTSPIQMGLIEQLIAGWQAGVGDISDGRTLFCVGDPMQSIYRFRKANVSLFLQASIQGIGDLALTPLRLTRNNRSCPAVINWINQAFAKILPSKDIAAAGAISYRAFTAMQPALTDEGVTIHPVIFNDEAESTSAKAVEAAYVAQLIAQEKTKDSTHKIAVLVRSRSHLRELVFEIRRNHPSLKFQAVEIEELTNRQTVQDALSLTYALLHRADRVHWLSILRAPWCGLTLNDLHALCADDQKSTIWQLMQDDRKRQTLSHDGQKRLSHVHEILTEAFAHQGRMPLMRWLESTWLKLGGAGCLIDTGDIRDIQAYFGLIDQLSQNGQLDFTQLETAMQKLYAKPDVEADDSLQFLTIHKSKGLEFDTVILPALNRQARADDTALLLWEEVLIDGHLQLIAAPFLTKKKDDPASIYHYLQNLESTRALNESARLLYVAATRTVRKLHLIATIKPSQNGEIKPIKKSFLDLLWPIIGGEFLRVAENQQLEKLENKVEAIKHKELDLADFIPQLIRLPTLQIPDLLKEVNSKNIEFNHLQYTSNHPEITPSNKTISAENLVMDCGTLAHLYMELIANNGLESWSTEKIKQLQPAMVQWLTQQGHLGEAAQIGAAHIVSSLQTTLMSEQGRWLLQQHEQASSELSLMQITNSESNVGVSKNHRIDRTFICDGKRWIIDYKLTQPNEQTNLEQQAENHRPQLARYASLFAHEAQPIQQAVFFLNAGKLILI